MCSCKNQTFVDTSSSFLIRTGGLDLSKVSVIEEAPAHNTKAISAKQCFDEVVRSRVMSEYDSTADCDYFLLDLIFKNTVVDYVDNKFAKVFDYGDDIAYPGLKFISDLLLVVDSKEILDMLVLIRDCYIFFVSVRPSRKSPDKLSGYNEYVSFLCKKYSTYDKFIFDIKLRTDERVKLNSLTRLSEDYKLQYEREDYSMMNSIIKNRKFFCDYYLNRIMHYSKFVES